MKFKNRLKKIVVGACTIAAFLCCSLIPAFADEEASDSSLDVGNTFDGKQIPYLPEEVYGKNFVLFYQELDKLHLYIFPEHYGTVTAKGAGANTSIIQITFPDTNVLLTSYIYSSSSGWSEPTYITDKSAVVTPSDVYIIKSTVDILNTDDNSVIYFAKNTDIIQKKVSMEIMNSFGSMINGFFDGTEKNPVALFCFACVVGVGLIGILRQFVYVRF